ncbi:MAG: glycosyltransferase family 2 protein [Propionibacteriaceae bacterium]
MSRPVVSVVLPTNRMSPHLGSALDSLAAQTFSDWELIVVDDGSGRSDELAQVLSRHVDDRFQLLQQDSLGVSSARNVGASVAVGEFLVFLDDDDLMHPARLEKQVARLQQSVDCGACYCGGWHVDDAGQRGSSWSAFPPDRTRLLNGQSPLPRIQTLMFRRSVFAQLGGFNSAIRLCEDHDLTLRALQITPFCRVDEELAAYRRHRGNTTAIANVTVLRAGENVVRYQVESARQRGDVDVERALRGNLAELRRGGAERCGADSIIALRRGELSDLARAAAWGLSRSPAQFTIGTVRRVSLRLRRTGRR